MLRDFIDMFLDEPALALFITVCIGACVLLVGLALYGVSLNNTYIKEHHCVQTDERRMSGGIVSNGVFIPSFEYQFKCEGGETRWF